MSKKKQHTSKKITPVQKKPAEPVLGYILANVLWLLSIVFLGFRPYREYIAIAILFAAVLHVLVIMRDTQMKAKIRILVSGIVAMAANAYFLSANTILFWIVGIGTFGVGLYEEICHIRAMPEKGTELFICIAKAVLLTGGALFLIWMELNLKV